MLAVRASKTEIAVRSSQQIGTFLDESRRRPAPSYMKVAVLCATLRAMSDGKKQLFDLGQITMQESEVNDEKR